MQSGKTRPIGVTILAILAILVGAVGLTAGIVITAFTGMLASTGLGTLTGGLLSTLGYIIGGVVLFFGLIWLLTGWGLLTGKGWSRILALIFSILSLIGTLFVAISGSIGGIIGCVIWALMLYYLFTPPVKAFFKGGASPSFSSGGSGSPSLGGSPSLPTSFSNPLSRSSFGSSPSSPSNTSNPSGSSGSSNYSGNRFCTNCGSTLSPSSNKCPSCGTQN